MSRTIVLSDGVEFPGEIGHVRNMLEFKMSLQDAAANLLTFSDQEAMKTVELRTETYRYIYHGFNKFSHLEKSDDRVNVWMHGDGETSVEEICLIDPMYMPKGVT